VGEGSEQWSTYILKSTSLGHEMDHFLIDLSLHLWLYIKTENERRFEEDFLQEIVLAANSFILDVTAPSQLVMSTSTSFFPTFVLSA